MNRKPAIVIFSVVVGLTSHAFAQGGYARPGAGTGGSREPLEAPASSVPLPPDPEANAEDLRLNGKCEQAIPIFRRLAERNGFEIAQLGLGLCLLELSQIEPDAQRVASLQRDAAQSIVRAANGGLAKAQIRLVSLYLDGTGVASDPIEAGKWALLYHSNGERFVIGLPDVPHDLQNRLDNVLTATSWAQAQARASAWSPATRDWDAAR